MYSCKKVKYAVSFVRVSSKEQEDGFSLQAQKDRIKRYCANNNLEIIKSFDLVESSTKGKRPEFYRMLDFIKTQKECIAIVCDKVDRLQRTFMEYNVLYAMQMKERITLHFVSENLRLDAFSTPQDLMMYQFHIMIANAYINSFVANVKRSTDKMLEEGKYGFLAPLGYLNTKKAKNNDIILDSERAPILKKLFYEFSKGIYNLQQITEKAQEWGLTTRTQSTRLHKQTISTILRNKFYCGYMTVKGQMYKHTYKTLVDEETWQKCQDILDGKMNHKVRKNEALFQGILHCAKCGRTITTDYKSKKNGKVYRYLICPKCKTTMNENDALKQVNSLLERLKNLPKSEIEKVLPELEKMVNEDVQLERMDRSRLENEYKKLEEKRSKLLELRIMPEDEGGITQIEYNKLLTEIRNRQDYITEHLSDYAPIARKCNITLKALLSLLLEAKNLFESSNIDKKRALLKILYSNLEIDGKKCLFSMNKAIESLLSIASESSWLGWQDSNLRMSAPKADALPLGDTPTIINFLSLPLWQDGACADALRIFRYRSRPRMAKPPRPATNHESGSC